MDRSEGVGTNMFNALMRPVVLALLLTFSCSSPDAITATAAPLSGRWLLQLSSNDVGTVRMVMRFNATDSTFSAATRPNADRDILGSWKSFLARTFTSDFKNGCLMRVGNGKITNRTDSLFLRGDNDRGRVTLQVAHADGQFSFDALENLIHIPLLT